MTTSARQTQADIKKSLAAFPVLAQQPQTDVQMIEQLNAEEALEATDTDITNKELTSQADAINELARRLSAKATDLNNIHQRVVDLTNTMNGLKSAADALGKLAAQLPKPGANKQTSPAAPKK